MTITVVQGTHYATIEIDLGVAHSDYEIEINGDTITVEYIDGELEVKLNEKDEPTIPLHRLARIETRPVSFNKLYFTNVAQTGKSAILKIGRAAAFLVYPRLIGAVGLLDVAEARINPAKEDGNLASILGQLDITLSALRDALRGVDVKDFSTLEAALSTREVDSITLIGADETAGQSVELNMRGKKLLGVIGKATAATDFTLEVSPNGVN